MIRGYVGGLGSGKTFSMVLDAVLDFRACPVQVYSNMAGLRCPEAAYVEALADLPFLSNGKVLLDEIGVFMSSRFWHKVPMSVLQAMAMGRKNGLDLFWTAQHEARVDTVLREITAEIVFCHRVGPWIVQSRYQPGKPKTARRRLVRLDPRVFPLYDTFETIDTEGRSSGRGAAARPLSVAAGKSLAKRDRERHARAPISKSLLYETYFSTLVPTTDARRVYDWLRRVGALDPAAPWSEQVRAEIERRRWLTRWKLGPDDAPVTCTPSSPWLLEHDPASVEARRVDRELQEAREAAAELEGKKNARSVSKSGGLRGGDSDRGAGGVGSGPQDTTRRSGLGGSY